jgi:L-alanine-DL-glutamate epimerase-like enolase superfamily enzyme
MAEAGAEVVEDPCAFVPNSAFRGLQQASPVPLLVDFGCTSLRDAGLFIEQGATALSVKPGRFGLSQARAMQALAQDAGCSVTVGLMGESVLGTLAGLQFAATVPQPMLPAELTSFLAMTEQITVVTLKIVDGAVDLPDVPSLAALVDWHAVERLAAA